jgi:hypothetical protein
MRHCPWQLAVCHPERFLLLPLLRSPPHRHARSVRTMAVNHSIFIANANPDFHHGLLANIAVADHYAEWLLSRRGAVDSGVPLEF